MTRARTPPPPPPPPPPPTTTTTRGGRVRLGRRARGGGTRRFAVSDGRGASGSAPEGFERLREEVRPGRRAGAGAGSGSGSARREPRSLCWVGTRGRACSAPTRSGRRSSARAGRGSARAGSRGGRARAFGTRRTREARRNRRRNRGGGRNRRRERNRRRPLRPRAVDAFVARSDARREDERGPDATEDGRFGRRVARAARAGAARAVAFEEGAFGSPRGKRRLFLGRRKRKRIARPVRRVRGVRAALERVHVREGASRSRPRRGARARRPARGGDPAAAEPATRPSAPAAPFEPRARPRKSESRRRRRRRRPRRRKKTPAQEPRSAEPPPVKAARTCVSLWRPSASPSRREVWNAAAEANARATSASSSPRRRRGTRSRRGGVSGVATDRIPRTKAVTTNRDDKTVASNNKKENHLSVLWTRWRRRSRRVESSRPGAVPRVGRATRRRRAWWARAMIKPSKTRTVRPRPGRGITRSARSRTRTTRRPTRSRRGRVRSGAASRRRRLVR